MKIKISVKYSTPEPGVLEIGFYRGENLIHNVFYDIEGLNDDEFLCLKQEALAKFGSCFPDISTKDIMKGFAAVDPMMQKLYKETFNPRGAGNKTGSIRTEQPAKRRTIRMTDIHYTKFLEKGGVKRLRELLDKDIF